MHFIFIIFINYSYRYLLLYLLILSKSKKLQTWNTIDGEFSLKTYSFSIQRDIEHRTFLTNSKIKKVEKNWKTNKNRFLFYTPLVPSSLTYLRTLQQKLLYLTSSLFGLIIRSLRKIFLRFSSSIELLNIELLIVASLSNFNHVTKDWPRFETLGILIEKFYVNFFFSFN